MKIKVYDYPSGVKVFYGYDRRLATTSCNLVFNVGSINEKKYGALHFFEHMVFLSTQKRTRQERQALQEEFGSKYNASTSYEFLKFYYECLSEFFHIGFGEFVEGITQPKFDPAEIKNEKKVILQEYNRYDAMPIRKLSREVLVTLSKTKDYGHFVLGTPSTIAKMSINDLKYCLSLLTPDRLIIYGAGSIKFKEYKKIIEQHLAKIIFMKDYNALPNVEFRAVSKPKYFILDANKEQVQVSLMSDICDRSDYKKGLVLSILNSALNGINGRLFNEMRNKEGLVYSVSAYKNILNKSSLIFEFSFGTAVENVTKALTIFKNCLKDIAENGITDKEFFKYKNLRKIQKAYDRIYVYNVVCNMVSDLQYYGKIISLKDREKILENITNDDIKDIANQILKNKRFVIGANNKNVKIEDLKIFEKI